MVPNCWLDPAVAKRQAEEVLKRAKEIYPDCNETFDTNWAQLNKQFELLIVSVEAVELMVSKLENKSIVSSDPRLKYLTRSLGLEDVHLLWFSSVDETEALKSAEAAMKKLGDPKPLGMLWVGDNEVEGSVQHEDLVSKMFGRTQSLTAFNFTPPSAAESDEFYFSEMQANLNQLYDLVKQ